MNPSRGNRTIGTRTSLQLLFLATAAASLVWSGRAAAADTVTLRDGRTQQGEIVGVENGNVMLSVGAGTIGLQLAGIASVDKAAPAAYADGMTAYESGDSGKALGLLRPIAEKFAGLPTDWARTATGAVADLYLAIDDYDGAAKAFETFLSAYGGEGGGTRAEVGRARIEFAQGDSEAARKRIQPILDEALGVFAPESSVASAYSQAFLLAGRLDEQAGNTRDALVNYLRTVTVYFQDAKAAAQAAERAEALQQNDPQLVVP